MRARTFFTLVVVTLTALSGCLGATVKDPARGTSEATEFETPDGSRWSYEAVAGAPSTISLSDGDAQSLAFEEGVLVLTEDGRLLPAHALGPIQVTAGSELRFVPPPGSRNVTITLGGATMKFGTPQDPSGGLISGENVVALIAHQEANFPNRRPGHENYAKSHEYFREYFEALGYEVEVDPYGTSDLQDAGLPAGPTRGIGPASVANVVAYKPGTLADERFIVFGGHYDVVEETTHGAFDNTGGSMAVLEMARAFANVTTSHTLVFALWGGEEDGILGSRFWVETNPEKLPRITTYVNLDVTGVAWPGPVDAPDPVLVTAGPDGPMADELLATAAHIVDTYARWGGAEFLYQPMGVGGQVGGAGINAQSDHTSFASKGIPSFMFSTGNIDVVFSLIHSEADTLANMTAYMVTAQAPFGDVLTPAEVEQGRALLAASYETQMWVPFYHAVLADAAYAE